MIEKARVLIVDDEESVRSLLRELLQDEGFRVVTAGTAEEALFLLGAQSFDVILTDIMMPGLSGIEMLRQVREFGLSGEVIVMTGHATYDTIVEAGRNGAFDYLKKPFEELEYILTVVQRAAQASLRTRRGTSVREQA